MAAGQDEKSGASAELLAEVERLRIENAALCQRDSELINYLRPARGRPSALLFRFRRKTIPDGLKSSFLPGGGAL